MAGSLNPYAHEPPASLVGLGTATGIRLYQPGMRYSKFRQVTGRAADWCTHCGAH
jgi:hypothetical protein